MPYSACQTGPIVSYWLQSCQTLWCSQETRAGTAASCAWNGSTSAHLSVRLLACAQSVDTSATRRCRPARSSKAAMGSAHTCGATPLSRGAAPGLPAAGIRGVGSTCCCRSSAACGAWTWIGTPHALTRHAHIQRTAPPCIFLFFVFNALHLPASMRSLLCLQPR
jgi:hypothetical protein